MRSRLLILALATLSSRALADAPPTAARCLETYDASQPLKGALRLTEARQALLVCVQPSCPAEMQRECSGWLHDVENAMPSIVVRARAGGQDVLDVQVLEGTTVLASRLDAGALALDPGERHLRFEHAGAAPIERTVVLHEGEKLRAVDLDFTAVKGSIVSPPKATPPAPGPTPTTPRAAAPSRTLSYVLGGVSGVALIGFGTFGIWGATRYSHLKSTCAPSCSSADGDAVHTKLLVADVSLVVALASAGAAWLAWPSSPVEVGASPSPTGGTVVVGGRF